MKKLKRNTKYDFAPVFRLSLLDIIIIIVGLSVTFALSNVVWWYGFLLGFVLGHFFLFCNVVRMTRPLELTWAVVFVILATATVALGILGWHVTVSVSLFTTVLVVAAQVRKPSHHGFGWQLINPELPNWWESRVSNSAGG